MRLSAQSDPIPTTLQERKPFISHSYPDTLLSIKNHYINTKLFIILVHVLIGIPRVIKPHLYPMMSTYSPCQFIPPYINTVHNNNALQNIMISQMVKGFQLYSIIIPILYDLNSRISISLMGLKLFSPNVIVMCNGILPNLWICKHNLCGVNNSKIAFSLYTFYLKNISLPKFTIPDNLTCTVEDLKNNGALYIGHQDRNTLRYIFHLFYHLKYYPKYLCEPTSLQFSDITTNKAANLFEPKLLLN